MPSDAAATIYGFVLMNMKKSIPPYPNKSIPSVGTFPAPLAHTRNALITQFEAFAETINRSSSARDLGPAYGVGAELNKRNILFENLEKALDAYKTQLANYVKHKWQPPAGEEHMTGDKTVDALVAACIPIDRATDKAGDVTPTTKDHEESPQQDKEVKTSFTESSIDAYYYYYWSNAIGSAPNAAETNLRTFAIADWRFDLACMHFNLAVIYLNCAAHLAFLCSAVSYPNYFMHDATYIKSYMQISQVSAVEKEAYAHCCTSAYHFEQAGAYVAKALKEGGTLAVPPEHISNDMTETFIQLLKEVLIAQGQEISASKSLKAAREESTISKMTFTSVTGRLFFGAKTLFTAAEALTQKDVVITKSSFASFVAAIQTKISVYEAVSYAVQGAYMAVPITSSQRIEMAIAEKERAKNGGNVSAATIIGEDAGQHPEDGLWCINKAVELAKPIQARALKANCSPGVRTWADFMLSKYVTDVANNINQLQQMGLCKKASVGPVPLKSAMVLAKVRPPQRATSPPPQTK